MPTLEEMKAGLRSGPFVSYPEVEAQLPGLGLAQLVMGLRTMLPMLGTPVPTYEDMKADVRRARRDQGMMGSVMANEPYRIPSQAAADQIASARAKEALQNLAIAGLTVYHGSPHKFDKFDSSKIGMGEGAQAYGYGLYLAENPGTAYTYSKMHDFGLGWADLPDDIAKKNLANLASKGNRHAKDLLQFVNENPKARVQELASEYFGSLIDAADANTQKVVEKMLIDSGIRKKSNTGALYTVDLPDDAIAKMLDWDKPMSNQAQEVRDAVKKIADLPEFRHGMLAESLQPFELKNTSGQTVVSILDRYYQGDRAKTSGLLNRAGIPGIRYLDAGSRSTGEGTRNFVVFPGNEHLLKILGRNGEEIKTYYRGTNSSGKSINSGLLEGALFATPKEKVAALYAGTGGKVSRIVPNSDAKILREGTKEFTDIVGRKDLWRSLKKGESLVDVGNIAGNKAKAAGYDAIEFNMTDGPELAIFNREKFKIEQ